MNCPQRPCLFSDQDEMNKFYKRSSIDALCIVLFQLAKRFQRRRFLTNHDEMRKLHKGPFIDASCQDWLHFTQQFQSRRVLKCPPIRNKNCPWRSYLQSNWDSKMSSLCKGPLMDALCIVWFHFAKWFQRRFLKIQPIRIKNCPWPPCLLPDRDEMRKLYKGFYMNVSCQIWFHFGP